MTEIENYEKEQMTIDLGWANIFGAIIFLPITVVFCLPYYFIWGNHFTMNNLKADVPDIISHLGLSGAILSLLVMIVGIVIHELIHGITWAIFAKNGFKSVKFGVLWRMITPYCHCKEPLKVSQYILGAIMPAIILGVLPGILSLIIGNLALLAFAIFFTATACGDFLIIHLLRNENNENLVLDHPSEAGCFVYRKIAE